MSLKIGDPLKGMCNGECCEPVHPHHSLFLPRQFTLPSSAASLASPSDPATKLKRVCSMAHARTRPGWHSAACSQRGRAPPRTLGGYWSLGRTVGSPAHLNMTCTSARVTVTPPPLCQRWHHAHPYAVEPLHVRHMGGGRLDGA
jgi:hypothetical protein